MTNQTDTDRLTTADVSRLLGVSKRQVRRLAAERGWPRAKAATGRPTTTYSRTDVMTEVADRQAVDMSGANPPPFRGVRPQPTERRPGDPGPAGPGGGRSDMGRPDVQAVMTPEMAEALKAMGALPRAVELMEAAEARGARRERLERWQTLLVAILVVWCLVGSAVAAAIFPLLTN